MNVIGGGAWKEESTPQCPDSVLVPPFSPFMVCNVFLDDADDLFFFLITYYKDSNHKGEVSFSLLQPTPSLPSSSSCVPFQEVPCACVCTCVVHACCKVDNPA